MRAGTLCVFVVAAGFVSQAAWSSQAWVPGPTPPPTISARAGTAMVYDAARNRLVVFGGATWSGLLADTWEHDGTRWVPGPAAPLGMVARAGHAMAFDGSRNRIVLFGGSLSWTDHLKDTWEYDGTTWLPGPSAPAGMLERGDHAMAFVASTQMTVVFGGRGNATQLNDTWVYDGASWVAGAIAPPALTPRYGASMCYDSVRDRAVLYGGWASYPQNEVNEVWELDSSGWSPAASAPAPHYHAGLAYDAGRKRTVLIGYGELWEYDGTSWTAGAGWAPWWKNFGVAYHAAMGRVVIFGGLTTYSSQLVDGTQAYDGSSWQPVPGGFVPRVSAAMAYDSDRSRVVLFGGSGSASTLNDTWELDGAQWVQGPPAPPAMGGRYAPAMAFDKALHRCVLFGGSSTSGQGTWLYDGTAWSQFVVGPPVPGDRWEHAMAYDVSRARVVMFGGYSGSGLLNDTWELDGNGWKAGPAAPYCLTPRYAHTMAYDSVRHRVVLFGGEGDGTCPIASPQAQYARNDTWEYDGTQWTEGAKPPAGLEKRILHAMAFDEIRGLSVMMGGTNLNGIRDDTWVYDGSWVQEVGAPPAMGARQEHSMAYDPVRRAVVLLGGWNGSSVKNETWLYVCALSMSPTSLPSGKTGAYYSQTLTAGGGTPPYTFTVSAGALPPGLTLATTGVLSGTPSAAGVFSFTVTAADSALCSGSQAYTLRICPAIDITPPSLAPGTVGASYGVQLGGLFGAPPYEFLVTGGALPAGLTLWATGLLSGTPTAAGPSSFTVTTTDAGGCKGSRDYCLYINAPGCPAIVISPSTLPAAYLGAPYAQTLTASGGVAPYSFAVSAGALPPGVALAATGQISGVPSTTGSFAFTVDATDASGCVGAQYYGISIGLDYVVGAGLGLPNPNRVRVYALDGSLTPVDFMAYGAGKWGVNVASASIDGASPWQILTAPGPGDVFGPQVRAFTRAAVPIGKVNFYAYGTLRYGANVSVGDLDGDGPSEIVTGAGPGAVFGPHVRGFNFDGVLLTAIGKVSFFAYGTLRYGTNVNGGDVDGDGYSEILTGPGPSAAFGPQVRGFNFDGSALTAIAKINFNAFSVYQYGVNVAVGDVDADVYSEIACAPGPGPGSSFPARYLGFDFDAASIAPILGFDTTAFSTSYGGRVGLADVSGEGAADLLAGAGRDPAAAATVKAYGYQAGTLTLLPVTFDPFPGYGYGVNVAAGDLGF